MLPGGFEEKSVGGKVGIKIRQRVLAAGRREFLIGHRGEESSPKLCVN